MKKSYLIAAILISVSLFAQAQPKKESIKVLFELMQQDSLINKTFAAITSSLVSNMTGQLDSSYRDRMARVMEKSMEASKQVAKRMINEDMIDIYDKYFTQEEIDDFISFYKSKSGQKMISRIPDIQKDIMTIMSQKYTSSLQQEIMNQFDEIIKEASEKR